MSLEEIHRWIMFLNLWNYKAFDFHFPMITFSKFVFLNKLKSSHICQQDTKLFYCILVNYMHEYECINVINTF